MDIQAAVLEAQQGPFVVHDLVLEDPRPDEVLVEIAGTGVCHSDMLFSDGTQPFPRPLVLGHEGAGTVVEVGSQIVGFAPGDRVLLSFGSCGRCRQCFQGSPAYCEQFFPLNVIPTRTDGSTALREKDGTEVGGHWFAQSSFASHALTNERNLVKVTDDTLPLEILGPLGCGLQTGAGAVINAMHPKVGSSIVVFGVGGVGAAAIMAAAAAGCTTIIAVDIRAARLDTAREIGATHTIDATTTDDLAGAVRETASGPVDFSFDTAAVTARTAVDVIRSGGTAVLVAAGMGALTLNGDEFLLGKTVKGIFEGDAVPQLLLPTLMDLMRQGRFPVEKIVTTYALTDIADAVRDMHDGTAIKPVVLPGH